MTQCPYSPSCSLVYWPPLVRACDWLPAELQPGYTHSVSHQGLASPSRTPPPLSAAPAGTQAGRFRFNSIIIYFIFIVGLIFSSSCCLCWTLFSSCHFSGSCWARSSKAYLTLPPGGAGASAMVIARQWIPCAWAPLNHYLQQRLHIVSLVWNKGPRAWHCNVTHYMS